MTRILVFFFTVSIVLLSCKKDEDADQTSNPSSSNPCANVTCYNGGICNNGQCECPPGYTGNFCENQSPATGVRINSIVVTSTAPTDANGAGWDLTSGLDLYLANGTNCNQNATSYYQNVNPNSSYTFNVNWYIGSGSLGNTMKICLMDYDDLDADDYVASFNFNPLDAQDGWPTQLFGSSGGNSVTLNLTWYY